MYFVRSKRISRNQKFLFRTAFQRIDEGSVNCCLSIASDFYPRKSLRIKADVTILQIMDLKLNGRWNDLIAEHCSVTVFGNFIKSQKVSSHQLNFKTNDLVLLFKTI